MMSFFIVASCLVVAGEQPASPPTNPGGVRTFAEGVRIDWPTLTVEVDAEVALRDGPLELFACSPQTKEHESILVVPARPLHIFQAMGLIGLNPGRPVTFDEKQDRWLEPTGDPLELRIRYNDGRGVHIEPSQRWVKLPKSSASDPAPVLNWVLAGSRTLPDGRYLADLDGTIACLVDFESALITLGSRHSADNEELWLVANTNEIPPRGTKVTLLINSRDWRPTVEVTLANEHTAGYEGQLHTAEQLAEVLRPPPDDKRPGRLILHFGGDVSDDAATAFVEKLRKSGWYGSTETKRLRPKNPDKYRTFAPG